MVREMFNNVRQVFARMFTTNPNSTTLNSTIMDKSQVLSVDMKTAIKYWDDLYKGNAPWLAVNNRTLNLPPIIAAEIARLVTLEAIIKVAGSDRAEFVKTVIAPVLSNLRLHTEYACAAGGIVFKPYFNGTTLSVESIQHTSFSPDKFDEEGTLVDATFSQHLEIGDFVYTRFEKYVLSGTEYTITNEVVRTDKKSGKEEPAQLTDVEQWAHITPEVHIQNVEGPLFAYFKIPLGNTIDTNSNIGVSVYSRAVSLIEDADKQYQRMLWEFEGGELAIDASRDVFDLQDGLPIIPVGKERLFRTNNLDAVTTSGDALMKAWSPQLRETSIINGLNKILVSIEDACSLSRGTLSLNTVEARTAQEIKSTKQRSYSLVTEIQKALESALNTLITALGTYLSLYQLAPTGDCVATYIWDDSIIVDSEVSRLKDKEDVRDGIMSKLEYRMKWYGEDEKTAQKNLLKAKDSAEVETETDENSILGLYTKKIAEGKKTDEKGNPVPPVENEKKAGA